ncbi:tRNA (adenosine(37)-N6)-threonylcarbamoyltransferase complex transferase subunit TsaD [Patescibacteria group bacterium]|nr:MAG: tRNA (adenosine(37)-N6)-threonylcarbamoyltransferase complex transferase subunit TsaD [Patescibacteria group bacterium]
MKILSIETSCDETAVTILEARGSVKKPSFKVLGNALYSQARLHRKYGGVYPNLAKREHAKNLIPLLKIVLTESNFLKLKVKNEKLKVERGVEKILEREPELLAQFVEFIPKIKKPSVNAVAVTYGPGLEPALWVGVNFARALGLVWNLSVIPVNHMEAHFLSVLIRKNSKTEFRYPALALLISGGHTELIYSPHSLHYRRVGQTRDDAVGEAYDKVARMLGLSYPGGPQIAHLAEAGRKRHRQADPRWILPRPMIHSNDFDFSFAGLKTAVLYRIKGKKLSRADKIKIARAFEDAVADVLVEKTRRAILHFKPKSLIVAGGVIANRELRRKFQKLIRQFRPLSLHIPPIELSTDNSIMIALAAYIKIRSQPTILKEKRRIRASGGAKIEHLLV